VMIFQLDGCGGANNSPKNKTYEMLHSASDSDGFLDKRPKLRKMDMRCGTGNVRSIYRAGSLVVFYQTQENRISS
jgi:hypothetical protein